MAARLFFAAALVAVHSLPAFADPVADPMITAAPVIKRNHHDMAKRQAAATSPLPLTDYNFPYSAIPYQVNPYPVGRGPQSGYNKCNSTTEGPTSECQTMEVNSLADFCLWGSPTANGAIGDVEAAVVAYCTQPGHGTRLITPGSITAAQFLRTSAYIQITGLFNQNGIGLITGDTGGELDPHGADLLGNPLGGLVYSSGMPTGDNKTLTQVSSWNTFVGSGTFCIKLCDNSITDPNYCQNIFDLLGCSYNMPASYTPNEFTSCEADLQIPAGTYVENGQTLTWSQPASLPATSTLPWTPVVPSSSNCVTYSSAELFGTVSGASTATGTGSGAAATGTAKASGTGSTASSSAAGSKVTGPITNGASHLTASSGLFALLAAVVMLM